MKKLGYDVSPRSLSTVSEFPLQLPTTTGGTVAAGRTAQTPSVEPSMPHRDEGPSHFGESSGAGHGLRSPPKKERPSALNRRRPFTDEASTREAVIETRKEDEQPSTSGYTRPTGGHLIRNQDEEEEERRAIKPKEAPMLDESPSQEFPEREIPERE